MENIGIQPIYLAAQIVNFAIIVFLLSKFLYKPILKVLDERKKKIEEQMTLASKMKDSLEKDEKKRQEALKEAREEAKKIIEVAKKAAKKEQADILEKSKKEASSMIDKAKLEIAAERKSMQKSVEKEVVDLAATMAEKIIIEALGKKDQESIISKKVAEVTKVVA
jgi:F-type H+-transporting ATPase subunit b